MTLVAVGLFKCPGFLGTVDHHSALPIDLPLHRTICVRLLSRCPQDCSTDLGFLDAICACNTSGVEGCGEVRIWRWFPGCVDEDCAIDITIHDWQHLIGRARGRRGCGTTAGCEGTGGDRGNGSDPSQAQKHQFQCVSTP